MVIGRHQWAARALRGWRLLSHGLGCDTSESTMALECPAHLLGLVGNCYEIAHLGVGPTPDWLGLFRVQLDVSSSFAC